MAHRRAAYGRPAPTKSPPRRRPVRWTASPVSGASIMVPAPTYMATCSDPPGTVEEEVTRLEVVEWHRGGVAHLGAGVVGETHADLTPGPGGQARAVEARVGRPLRATRRPRRRGRRAGIRRPAPRRRRRTRSGAARRRCRRTGMCSVACCGRGLRAAIRAAAACAAPACCCSCCCSAMRAAIWPFSCASALFWSWISWAFCFTASCSVADGLSRLTLLAPAAGTAARSACSRPCAGCPWPG